jgi:tetratricopeptide (TPR) repeat protein
MAIPEFDTAWITQAEKDPYAALGVSIFADDRRISKRYWQVAKLLHPDTQVGQNGVTTEFANQLITRIINPTYQRLKQEKTRSEVLATMRFRVRRLANQNGLQPSFESAQQLLRIPEAEVDVFYENTLTQLAEPQFSSPAHFHQTLIQIGQLNLICLRRKMGDVIIREKRTGLVAAPQPPERQEPDPPPTNYAEKYRIRAMSYLQQQNYDMALQELRDALKIEPNNVEFHSLIAQVYFMQQKYGMAKAHLKRTLQLNPNHPVAQKYLQRLEQLAPTAKARRTASAMTSRLQPQSQGWLGRLWGRR